MSDAKIHLEIKKLKKTLSNLSNINYTSINRNIGQSIRNSTLDRFKKQVDPEGKAWIKKKYGDKRKKTLNDTGTLKNSINYKVSSGNIYIGTNLEYARTHQFGVKNRKIRAKKSGYLRFKIGNKWYLKKEVTVNIPKRAFLGINNDDKKEIANILNDYVERAIKK